MNTTFAYWRATAALFVLFAYQGAARLNADVVISEFDENYFEDALYGSWASATIEYGPESYSLTATGYGSNWTYIGGYGIMGAGNNYVQLDVTLEGPPAADGHLGPLVQLIDADGTHHHYRWYGQLLGNNLLTLPVESPSFVSVAGTTPGLDLDTLTHMHLELDPGGFGTSGPYTVRWNQLSLITVEASPGDFDEDGDVDGRDFLVWQRNPEVGNLSDWQEGYGSGGLVAISAVPEPSAICLLILAGISAAGRRTLFRLAS